MSFVIELGSAESVSGGSKVWQSRGYYADWSVRTGPIIVPTSKDALHFPTMQNAQNVVGGDERLRTSRILKVEE